MKKYEKVDQFFEQIKTLGFWQRIFNWRPFQKLSYEAFEEYKSLLASANACEEQLIASNNKIGLLTNDNAHIEKKSSEQQIEIKSIKDSFQSLQIELNRIKEENAVYKRTEADRAQDHESKIDTLTTITSRVQNEREDEKRQATERELRRLHDMKETWSRHEGSVKETIKMICQKHTITYVDQVPFKGKPDNTIQICEDFIIFDAKSPMSDDLGNFPQYIKNQTEQVKKYIKEQNVRKDIFLVIPSNAVHVIDNFSYNMADYNVYVVTIDVLEPLILALRKIEDYEFVEQLTPEDRESICRVIGKFAHVTKRKIQIDQFFTREFISVLKKSEANLPSDIFEKVLEFEKSEKINPPVEKRAKQILIKDLEIEDEHVREEVKKLPLYEDNENLLPS